jgi:hypothetical protein
LYYANKGLPTLLCDTLSVRTKLLPHIQGFYNCVSDLLTDNPLSSVQGHWFSQKWAVAQLEEWYKPAVESAFQVTRTSPDLVVQTQSEWLVEEWHRSWKRPRQGDLCRAYSALGDPPSLALPKFTVGVLSGGSHHYQSAAFQIITGHTFDGTYSSHFRQGADDNMTCP